MAYTKKQGKKKTYKKKTNPVVKELSKLVKMQKVLSHDTGLTVINKPKDKIWTVVVSDLYNSSTTNPVLPGDVIRNYSIQLTSIPNSAEYIALFNSFRIEKVKFTFIAEVLPSADGFFPTMLSSKWEDSGLVTPTETNFEQMTTVKRKLFSAEHRQYEHTVIPYALDEFFASAVTTGYAKVPANKQWFDVNSGSGIDFYCLTTMIPNATAAINGYNFVINCDIEYTVSFKDTH